ncbi:hypothetical protein HF295_04665 [Hujiaoplasma nucleasis]|uniref:Uncharacterized protein n=1 Tax=Hujiaoplasma nucleasis TaxID=2725268 RepID=A0A7L6N3Z4_9MOLU|nr:hypothetical protein [Hujiaoplasma nucleasis]QLY40192.1 hypothetical protein HF295_04665 [Hujiaoplasma nucleasis]
MKKEMTVRTWIKRFKQGDFESRDYQVQCEAGWYDWFCRETSLAGKTKRMGNIIKQVKDGGKVNLDTMYVWFKNNCPLQGPLYDDFRFASIEIGDTLLTIQIASIHNDKRYTVYGRKNHFDKPLFESDSSRELVKWLNEGWQL